MSQVIAYRSDKGIVLAADSKVVEFDFSGKPVSKQVGRLLQLGEHAAVLAGGVAKAAAMCQNLRDVLAEEKADDIQVIYDASLAFLANEFG